MVYEETTGILNCPICGALLFDPDSREAPEWCAHVQCAFHTTPCWIYAGRKFLKAYINRLISKVDGGDLLEDDEPISKSAVMRSAREGEFGEIDLPWSESAALGVCKPDAKVFTIDDIYDEMYIVTSSGIV